MSDIKGSPSTPAVQLPAPKALNEEPLISPLPPSTIQLPAPKLPSEKSPIPPPPPTPAAGDPPQPVFPEGTMIVTTADGKPIEAVVTEKVPQGVSRVEAILISGPDPVPVPEKPRQEPPQEKPLEEKESAPREAEPVEELKAVDEKAKEGLSHEESGPKPTDVPLREQTQPKPESPVGDVDPPSEKKIDEEPQLKPQVPAEEEPKVMPPIVERKADPEPEPEPEPESQLEPEPEQVKPVEVPATEELPVEDVKTKEEPPVQKQPMEKVAPENPPVGKPPVEEAPVEQPPAEEPPVEEPPAEETTEEAPAEEPPVEEPPLEEATKKTPGPTPRLLRRKRDVVRAKAVPKFPIKIIAGKEIAAVTVFLMKEKAKGNDIHPQLDALIKGG